MPLLKKPDTCSGPDNRSGNVLFLILIAVALFAALTYAISSTSRGGGDTSSDSHRIAASQIVAYAGSVQAALERMRVSRNLQLEQIEYSPVSTVSRNSACTSNACRLYHPEGGGVIPMPPPASSRYDVMSSSSAEYKILLGSVTNVGTNANDIILVVQGLKTEVCEEINKKLDIASPVPAGISFGGGGSVDFLSHNNWATPGQLTPTAYEIGEEAVPAAEKIKGQLSFCYCGIGPVCDPTAGPTQVTFVNVLVAR